MWRRQWRRIAGRAETGAASPDLPTDPEAPVEQPVPAVADNTGHRRDRKLYRQGDVLLVAVTSPPKDATTVQSGGRIVLASGEATGHAHRVESERAQLATARVHFGSGNPEAARLLSTEEAHNLFLLVYGDEAVALQHEEHDTLSIPPGAYRVVRQREYAPGPLRQRFVSD
jgi:hypothetical protein